MRGDARGGPRPAGRGTLCLYHEFRPLADGRRDPAPPGRPRVYVESAGVRAGGPDAFAIAAMKEIGIDISQHTPRTLRDLHDTSFDLIVTLSPEAHHQALELTRTMAVDVEYWPTFEPR